MITTKILALLAVFLIGTEVIYASDNPQKNHRKGLLPAAIDPTTTTLIDVNNLTSWITVNGGLAWPPKINGSFNGSFPKGVNAGFVYQDGIVFGGLVHDASSPVVRVGGSTYPTGMQPGSILVGSDGKVIGAEGANDTTVNRVWRVRPDYRTADLTDDAAAFFQEADFAVTQAQIDELRLQYEKDWNEWPASKGAPYVDVNGDGKYEPDTDIPGVDGAIQTIWTVANDLNSGLTNSLYGSPSIGIEEQITEWAWKSDTTSPLDDIIYKQVELIYKGTPTTPSDAHIDSMYIAQWSDVDDGYNGDDFAGCDSTESLGFVYNGEPFDPVYSPLGHVPPAGGYEIVNGSAYRTDNPADSAIIDFQWRKGYHYWHTVPMAHFIAFWDGSAIGDPELGSYNGTLEMYNLIRFALPYPSYPSYYPFWEGVPSPFNRPTNYVLSGDPTTHSGWVDGLVTFAGSRRIICIHGPINLALGDTAEIVVATIGADGSNYTGNVSELKWYGQWDQYAFTWSASPSATTAVQGQPTVPKDWSLSQNYPNPFNPTTTIKYVVLQHCHVTLYVSNGSSPNLCVKS